MPTRPVTLVLSIVVLLLTAANLVGLYFTYHLNHGNLMGLIPLFDLDTEGNLPTLYQAVALLLASVLLVEIAFVKKKEKDRYVNHWSILASIFAFLSLDEWMEIHEMSIEPLRSTFKATGIFYFSWVIPAAPIVFIVGLAYSRFLFDIPKKTMLLFMVAGSLFIAGALGMEMVGGHLSSLYGERNLRYALITTGEEVLEMAGVIVFIHALLDHRAMLLSRTEI